MPAGVAEKEPVIRDELESGRKREAEIKRFVGSLCGVVHTRMKVHASLPSMASLSPMAQADSELQRLLPQRPFSPLHKLRDLRSPSRADPCIPRLPYWLQCCGCRRHNQGDHQYLEQD